MIAESPVEGHFALYYFHVKATMVTEIKAEKLREMIDSGDAFTLVDGRAEEDYAVDRLPGAVSLLYADVADRAADVVRKGVPVVVYSNDADCPASGLVAAKLDKMGFGPVFDYNDSYKDWVARGYEVVPGS